jgi:hypothetical protein
MLPNDMYSQPNAADPVLEERTVLDLVRRHGGRCSAVTHIDATGGEARLYVLDARLVLKVQRPHRLRPRTSLEKEAFFLQQLVASRAALVLSDMSMLATRPQTRPQTLERLRDLLVTWT